MRTDSAPQTQRSQGLPDFDAERDCVPLAPLVELGEELAQRLPSRRE
jgi:hypothetical protein